MIQHHPTDNILVEFAAGTLDTAQAVAVNAHLHFCTKCQQNIKKMEQTGGAMLDSLDPEALAEESFDKLLSAIEAIVPMDLPTNQHTNDTLINSKTDLKITEAAKIAREYGRLPSVVAKMMSQKTLKWRYVNSSLQTSHLIAGQNIHQVSLQKISAGGIVPEHDHSGTEMTVVLKGSFSDVDGIYQAGDFILKEPGQIHQPISARNEDCLCLSVESAPVKLTGFFGRMINPFIKHNAA
jgi:putative transcriptional regulator